MKAAHFQSVSLGLALAVIPLACGCNQQSSKTPSGIDASISPAASLIQTTAIASASNPAIGESQNLQLPPAQKTLPPNVKPSAPVSEIIRLANAGLDASVMLAFVDNSQSAFNLSSDDIIYLSDIGVAGAVVTAMMERDQVLNQPLAAPVQAVAIAEISNTSAPEVEEQPIAVAPSYENPPEEQPLPVEQPPVVNYNYVYDNLGSYGSWIQMEDYGWCWQPTVVVGNPDWRPYCDRGRWINTDCGWYWQSDYSWGGTFHYGRWFNSPGRGWCWYPDRTWGPAWVTWRYNDNYCGWAPLPPRCNYQTGVGLVYASGSVAFNFGFGYNSDCYTFVSWRGLCDPQPRRHCLPPSQATTVYNNTTVINNFVRGDNNTIVNRGIAPERVSAITHRPVQTVAVHDAQSRVTMSRRGERNIQASQANGSPRPHEPVETSNRTTPVRNESANNRMRGELLAFASPPSQPQQSRPAVPAPTARGSADAGTDRGGNTRPEGRQETRGHSPAPWINHGENGGVQNRQSSSQDAPPGSLILNGNRNDSPVRMPNRSTQPELSRTSTQDGSRSSLVIIGKPNNAQQRGQIYLSQPSGSASAGSQNNASVPPANVQQPTTSEPNRGRDRSLPAQTQIQRPGNPRFTQRQESPSVSRPSVPMAVNRQNPPAATASTRPAASRQSSQQFNPSPAPVQSSAPAVVAARPARVESARVSSPQVGASQRPSGSPRSNGGQSGNSGSPRR